MKAIKIIIFNALLCLIFLNNVSFAQDNLPSLFLFLGGDKASLHESELKNSCATGAQIIYSWKQLEPKKGVYDFSKIENDLAFLSSTHKKLFIQIQDRSFEPTIFNVPDYIREDNAYHGGVAMQYDFPGEGKPITSGWVARVWDPAVRERFQLLIQKLAAEFDGKIYGINLPETAVDFDVNNPPKGFTYDNYFHAELDNINAVRKAFHNSIVIQYVNFFPGEWNNDHHYMSRLFSYAMKHQIGLGGPDVVPHRQSQMKNSYPFFHKLKGSVLAGMAIQEPDYTYINPVTGDYFTFSEFYNFTKDYLGASLLFWNVQEPFFSNQLAPQINTQYFKCNEPLKLD
jgi:hypothetical protein